MPLLFAYGVNRFSHDVAHLWILFLYIKKNYLVLSGIYTEHQKSCTTLLFVIIFQMLMAFEKNELSMNGQVISNRCYASAVKLSSPFLGN